MICRNTRFGIKPIVVATALAFILVFFAGVAHAYPDPQPPIRAAQVATTSTSTVTNYVVPAGTDRLLVVTVNTASEQTTTSATYDSIAMMPAVSADEGDAQVNLFYRLLGSGSAITANVVVSFGGTAPNPSVVLVQTYFGVDQTTPIGSTAVNTSANCSAGISTTPAGMNPSSLVHASIAQDKDLFQSPSFDSINVSEVFQGNAGGFFAAGVSYWSGYSLAGSSGSRTVGADPSNTQDCALAAMEIRPSTSPAVNPDLPAVCGLDFILILDASGSIDDSGAVDDVVAAADAFLSALVNTGSQVAVVEFASEAITRYGWTSLNDTNLTTLQNYLNNTYYNGDAGTYTNWQDAMLEAYDINAGGPIADMVVFVTDGDPTAYNDPSTGDPLENQPEQLAMLYAFGPADSVRGQGSHIFGIGVALPTATLGDSEGRLSAATGPDEYPTPETDFAKGDYTLTSDFDLLADALQDIAFALCGNSLTVTKYVDDGHEQVPLPDFPVSGTVNVTEIGQPAAGYTWEQPVPGDAGIIGQTQGGVTAEDGTFTWQWTPDVGTWDTEIDFSESSTDLTPQSPVDCDRFGLGDNVPAPFQIVGAQPWNVTFDTADIVTCDLINTGSFDWGDAPEADPSNYPTLAANSGARHLTFTGDPILGTLRDTEANGLPDALAEGDDNNSSDDEDGLTIPNNDDWGDGGADIDVDVTNGPACLNVWVDFNNNGNSNESDGDFGDTGEHVLINEIVSSGSNALQFTVPVDAANGATWYIRLRLTPQGTGTGACSQTDASNYLYADGVASPTNQAFGGEIEDYVVFFNEDGTTPVTLAYFQATRTGERVHFDWSTTTEFGTVGFNILARNEAGEWETLNSEIIPSKAVDSTSPQHYSYEAAGVKSDTFRLVDLDVWGTSTSHGPFTMGESYGIRPEVDAIDWAAIRAEHEAKEAARQSAAAAQMNAELSGTQVVAGGEANGVAIDLSVRADGIYRLTYEQLLAAGFDLNGVKTNQLALLNQGQPQPFRAPVSRTFGPGGYLEFYGWGLDTLYTDTNIYTLLVDPLLSRSMPEDNTRPQGTTAPYYMETKLVEAEKIYSFLAPNGDPWLDTRMLVYTTPASWNYTLEVDNYLAGAAPATLDVGVWGAGNWPAIEPDHHLLTGFNGQQVAEQHFDGTVDASFSVELPAGSLQEGSNTLQLTLPADTGAAYEMTMLDKYGVTYPRAFVARNGALSFTAAGQKFQVTGLPTNDVVVYRIVDGAVTNMRRLVLAGQPGNYSVTFAGYGTPATYLVASQAGRLTPGIAAGRPYTDITSGTADYLVISHADFAGELGDLIAAREAQGFTVKVVDVADVYAQFSYGVFDPAAIKEYVAHAAANMGVEYVLLVGGDTYDYRNYLGTGGISFIPSLYMATGAISQWVPVDPLYADTDDDGVPDDVALGRFPVRTSAELGYLIEKTLTYDQKNYGGTALFAADEDFSSDSISFANGLPPEWSLVEAYLDEMDVATAKGLIISTINDGVAYSSYVGHSGPVSWTFAGLFHANDAAALTNFGEPTVVTQWGCWNTYYVEPANITLAHKFLVAGEQGAAAVLGATGVSLASSEEELGRRMTPYLVTQGMTIGEAMRLAKSEVGALDPTLLDVLYGWTILGDPAVVVNTANQ